MNWRGEFYRNFGLKTQRKGREKEGQWLAFMIYTFDYLRSRGCHLQEKRSCVVGSNFKPHLAVAPIVSSVSEWCPSLMSFICYSNPKNEKKQVQRFSISVPPDSLPGLTAFWPVRWSNRLKHMFGLDHSAVPSLTDLTSQFSSILVTLPSKRKVKNWWGSSFA